MPRAKGILDGYRSLTPHLIVADCNGAIEFYQRAFGATERMRVGGPGGKIGHAELVIGDSAIMLADEFPEMNCRGPTSIGGTPVSLYLYVDAVAVRAVAAGAKTLLPVETKFYGDRSGTFEDPYGHQWHISTHVEDVPPDELARRAEAAMTGRGK